MNLIQYTSFKVFFLIKKLPLLFLFILLFLPKIYSQGIPETINYQGILKDAAGNIVPDGNYELTFTLYDAESAGTNLWFETKTITVTNGILSTRLGTVTSLPQAIFNAALWLGIKVGAGSELLPRITLSSVPYCFYTMNVLDGSITADKIADGEIVKGLNGLKDNINLIAGSNVIITPSGQNLTISAAGGGGGTVTQVNTGVGLTGGPITSTGTISIPNDGITNAMLQTNSVTSNKITDGTITATDIGNNQLIKSLNSLKDNVNLVAGSNVTITPNGQNLTISATGSTGIGGSGTTNTVPVFTNSTTLGNSNLIQDVIGMRLTNSISSNINPTLILNRTGTNSATSLGFINNSGNSYSMGMRSDGKFGISSLNNNVGLDDAFVINTADNSVGIGSYNPTGKLEILCNSIDPYPQLLLSETDGFARVSFRTMTASTKHWVLAGHTNPDDNSSQWHLNYFNGSAGKNIFSVFGNSIISFDGNVGIGTTNPTYPLQVETNQQRAGYFKSNYLSSTTYVLYGEFVGSGSQDAVGVYGKSVPNDYYGYGGYFEGGFNGVRGTVNPTGSSYYTGVLGLLSGGSGSNFGVNGQAYNGSTNYGVYGIASGGTINWAGYFAGNVNVTGTISKGGGSFKIDHPLDPANKYLYHSFVESPDMMNVYNGNVETDASGYATITLPDWFEALNRDFRYQLTVIGDFAQAIIAQEVQNNQFVIRTDKPNVKVSWQVTGIRHDKFAEKNRIPVEENKTGTEVGKYLHPDVFGISETQGIDYENNRAVREKK